MLDPKACPICKGARFVCENHPRLAWPSECDCGAGDPFFDTHACSWALSRDAKRAQ